MPAYPVRRRPSDDPTLSPGTWQPVAAGREPVAEPGSVVARGVTVRYGGLVAVDAVDLVVAPGTFLALTGPSGAGKSSLLWAIAGAVTPVAGESPRGTRASPTGAPASGRDRAIRRATAWPAC